MNFESSNKEALYVLRSKRELLEAKIKEKIKELKAACLQEAELTGILPPDTPLEPGESLPKFRRKIPSAFCYQDDESSTLRNPKHKDEANFTLHNPKDEATLFSLELECKEQKTIADVALGLANDEAATKSTRRKHRLVYQQSQRRLQELESRLTLIKQSVSGSCQLKHRKVAPQLSGDTDRSDNGDNKNVATFCNDNKVVKDCEAYGSFRDKGRQRKVGLQICNEDDGGDNNAAIFRSGDRTMRDCVAYDSFRNQMRQRKVASQIYDEVDNSDKDSSSAEIICSGDLATKDRRAYNSFRDHTRQRKVESQIRDEVDSGDKGSSNDNAATSHGSDNSMKDRGAYDSFRSQMKRRNVASQMYDEGDSGDSCSNIAAMFHSGDQTLKKSGFYDSFGKSNRHNTLPSRSNPQSIPNNRNNFLKSSSQSVNQIGFGSPRSQRSLNFDCSLGEPATFEASGYSNQCYSSMTSCSAKEIKMQMMSRYGSLDRRYLKSRSANNNNNQNALILQEQDNFRSHIFNSANRDDCSTPHSSMSSLNSQKSGPTKLKSSNDVKNNNENSSVLLPNQTYPENTFARAQMADNLSCKSAESTDQLFTNNNNTLSRRNKEKEWKESSLDSPEIPIQKRNPTPPLQPRAATATIRPPHIFPHPPPPVPPQNHHISPLPRRSSPQGDYISRHRQNDRRVSPLIKCSSPPGDNISRHRQSDHCVSPSPRCSSPPSDNISRHRQNDHHKLPLPRCPSPQCDDTSRQHQNDRQTPPPVCVSPVDLIENAVPVESPKNHTIVEVGKWQPYREVTKPFEMSDFYKYSTKFRKNTQNNNIQDCDSAKLVQERNNNNKLDEKTFVDNNSENDTQNKIDREFDARDNYQALNLQNVTDRKHRQRVNYQ